LAGLLASRDLKPYPKAAGEWIMRSGNAAGMCRMATKGSQSSQGTVVVGIDGSERSTAALEWASSYAEATGVPVRAVAVWRGPGTADFDVGGGWDHESACRKRAEKQVVVVVVVVVVVATSHPDLGIKPEVVRGDAREPTSPLGGLARKWRGGFLAGGVSAVLVASPHRGQPLHRNGLPQLHCRSASDGPMSSSA